MFSQIISLFIDTHYEPAWFHQHMFTLLHSEGRASTKSGAWAWNTTVVGCTWSILLLSAVLVVAMSSPRVCLLIMSPIFCYFFVRSVQRRLRCLPWSKFRLSPVQRKQQGGGKSIGPSPTPGAAPCEQSHAATVFGCSCTCVPNKTA